ncbi:hypothetical protein AB0D11_18505 [Streptomyces monashensis]|uniref:hypothetical protein n=1 Tax=Streptomyces monashensis TaxID=1678012 RepID=UPI0033DB54F9
MFENTTDADGEQAYRMRNEYSGTCMGVASHRTAVDVPSEEACTIVHLAGQILTRWHPG